MILQILSSSVHPPMPRRVPQTPAGGGGGGGGAGGSQTLNEPNVNGHTPRRAVANVTRDPTQPNGRGFGGFGRGEGGALAGAIGKPGVIGGGAVPPPGEGKAPGVLGGGFGGVGKRLVRGRTEPTDGSSGMFLCQPINPNQSNPYSSLRWFSALARRSRCFWQLRRCTRFRRTSDCHSVSRTGRGKRGLLH